MNEKMCLQFYQHFLKGDNFARITFQFVMSAHDHVGSEFNTFSPVALAGYYAS